ncbi:LysE family translocator [Bradyrhizobium sp. 1AS2L]
MIVDFQPFLLFLGAALLVAITSGSGIFYVAARTFAGGRPRGLASSFGTGVGGLVHFNAGAVGISALVMASAEAFTMLKLAGAFYLIWLGFKTRKPRSSTRSGWRQSVSDGHFGKASLLRR